MRLLLGLEFGSYPLWELTEDDFIVDNILAKDLGLSIEIADKIDKLNELYHSLFINTDIEFAYIGNEKPEIEEEVKRLNEEEAKEIKTELKTDDELVKVWDFHTSKEEEAEEYMKKRKKTVNSNAHFESMSEGFNYLPDKLEYGSDFSLEYDRFTFYLTQGAFLDGKYDFPIVLDNEIKIPKYLVPFSQRKRIKKEVKKDVALHFYMHDKDFSDFLQHPEKYLKEVKEYGGIVSPDPSLYTNMALAMQLYHSFINRAVTFFLQKNKVNVIPNVRWGSVPSFEFCFDGLVTKGTYAISGYGCIQKKEDKELFKKGLMLMLEKLEPKLVLVYGPMPKSVFEEAKQKCEFLHFEEWTHLVHSEEGKSLLISQHR